jgi:predicted membrane-bound dolichyl-phosphate-mannose-protein mannosyltransferase
MASNGRALSRWSPASENALLAYLALAKLLVHLLTNGNYGYFRDEFYYVAAGERLDLGYVDFPPLVAIVAKVSRFLLGDSPVALRFFPALAGALVVVLAGLMARELGGGRFAQGLAALATLVAPNFLAMGTFLSMDAFDQLFWVSAAYVLLLILRRGLPRLWLLFGLIVGLGLLTKVTMLFFGVFAYERLVSEPAESAVEFRGALSIVPPFVGHDYPEEFVKIMHFTHASESPFSQYCWCSSI